MTTRHIGISSFTFLMNLLHCLTLALRDDARLGPLDRGVIVRWRPDFVTAEVEKPFAERFLCLLLPLVQSIFPHDPLPALLRLTFANDLRISPSCPHAILMRSGFKMRQ